MAGTGIQIRIDAAAVRAAFGRRRRVRDLRPVFDAIGAALVVSTQRRFEAQRRRALAAAVGDHDPRPARRQPRQRLRRARPADGAGRCRRRHVARHGPARAVADPPRRVRPGGGRHQQDRTNKIYGRLHQRGGVIRPKTARRLAWGAGAWRFFARQVTVPARPFLGVEADDRAMIGRTLLRHLGAAAR